MERRKCVVTQQARGFDYQARAYFHMWGSELEFADSEQLVKVSKTVAIVEIIDVDGFLDWVPGQVVTIVPTAVRFTDV